MAELDAIAQTLRRQRKDLDDERDSTKTRIGTTAELVEKIEDLRRRVEDTQRRFAEATADAANDREK